MDDSTRHPDEHQPLTAEDLRVLDVFGEAYLAEATRRIARKISLRTRDFMQEVLDRTFPERTVEAVRGTKALLLAPNLNIYWALMRGERVPWSALDFFKAQQYGLKRRHSDGRYGLDDFNDVARTL